MVADRATQLTFTGEHYRGVWSPDETRVMVTTVGEDGWVLREYDVTARAPAEVRYSGSEILGVSDWPSEDVVLVERRADGRTIELLDPSTGQAQTFKDDGTVSMFAEVSRNGRWVAYASDLSGSSEIYVESFPEPGTLFRISTGGGYQPRWSPDDTELFFLALDRTLMSARVTRSETSFEREPPLPRFSPTLIEAELHLTSNVIAEDSAIATTLIHCSLCSAGRSRTNASVSPARSSESSSATRGREPWPSSALHEDMHGEAFTYTRQTLEYPPPPLETSTERLDAGPLDGDAEIPGARFMLGASKEAPFVFDNEKWAHPVDVEAFRIARAPVTHEAFAAFVDDGGYRRREWWSHEGWIVRADSGREHPTYWVRDANGWLVRHFDRVVPLGRTRPSST